MTITEKLETYLEDVRGEHDRERSWEHCYRFFHGRNLEDLHAERDHAALHLGFYLASWGMYRPSSFLFRHSHTIHLNVVDRLCEPEMALFWSREFGANSGDKALSPALFFLRDAIRSAYRPFGDATDALVTKVMLGTIGCFPAVDRYFKIGFTHAGFKVPRGLPLSLTKDVVQFCRDHIDEFQSEQARVEQAYGMRYPLMKLVDMYFHQIGIEVDTPEPKKKTAMSGQR